MRVFLALLYETDEIRVKDGDILFGLLLLILLLILPSWFTDTAATDTAAVTVSSNTASDTADPDTAADTVAFDTADTVPSYAPDTDTALDTASDTAAVYTVANAVTFGSAYTAAAETDAFDPADPSDSGAAAAVNLNSQPLRQNVFDPKQTKDWRPFINQRKNEDLSLMSEIFFCCSHFLPTKLSLRKLFFFFSS